MKELLLQYANYNLWANARIVEMIGKLDEYLIDKEIKNSFPSVRKTVYHIWDAEMAWILRMRGEVVMWPPSNYIHQPSFEKFISTSRDLVDFVSSKDDFFWKSPSNYKNSKGIEFETLNPDIIMHCCNHSTFHRGQIITALRNLGVEKFISTDFISFLRE